jgi:hypothetical protein
MMDLITQFAIDCAGQKEWDFPKDPKSYTFTPDELEKFAELIVRECMDNLAWHGHDEAVSQLEWFKINKLEIK